MRASEDVAGGMERHLRVADRSKVVRAAVEVDVTMARSHVGILDDDVELGLLLDRLGSGSGAGAGGRHGDRSGGGDTPLVLQSLHQLRGLQDGKRGKLLNDLV